MPAQWTWEGALIVRVIDGDSFVARLRRDLGFHGVIEFEQRLRVLGVNTPPLNTAKGKAAAIYVTEQWLNRPCTIVTGRAYKYGDEWMADATLAGKRLSEELVKAGHAEPWSGKGARPGG